MICGQCVYIRSPEPASNNATLAVIGRFEVALSLSAVLEGIRGFVRENYYPHIAELSCAKECQTE